MNITYDKQADAMYIYLQKKKRVARTVELANLLFADLDKKDKVLGEIIGVSPSREAVPKNQKDSLVFPFRSPHNFFVRPLSLALVQGGEVGEGVVAV